MNKKKIIIGIIIIVLSLLIIFGIKEMFKDDKEDNPKNNIVSEDAIEKIEGKAYKVGYLNQIAEENKKILISDYQTFEKYFNENANFYYGEQGKIKNKNQEILDKYSESYFQEKKLGVMYEVVTPSSSTVENVSCEVENEVAYIRYDKFMPGVIESDESDGFFIIVELPIKVTSIEH